MDSKNKLNKVADYSHEFTLLRDRFEENFLELKDIIFELQNKAEAIEVDAHLLEELNAKVNKINALFLKHGVGTVEELVTLRDALAAEQSGFADLEDNILALEKTIADVRKQLDTLSKQLSANRKKRHHSLPKR
ncbi:hypothetical protein BPO_1066 [Bergeyella porcorum]|uniref:Uncharacterized protein n=1 Tax=Bergeyella porcorum TaxID=1735111 RepID=A0AAU0F313_9FLAO